MSQFKEVMTGAEGVYLTMHRYSGYTIESKFPNTIDGLKPIHRRILMVLHDASDDYQKEATVAGKVMEKHPHGDASISAAITSLAQPFTNIVPLVESASNVGTYVGDAPAAARYVDVHGAEIAEDLFFRGTDFSSLQMVPCESEKGVEPANFVPILPNTLIFPVLGIGCGYKTETSAISLANCCKATKKFITMKYKNPDGFMKQAQQLAPYLIPDFPSRCYLRNSSQIIEEYWKGNFDCPFVIDGIMDITKDTIRLITLPPDKPFGKVTADSGIKTVREKNSWLHETFQDAADLTDKHNGGCEEGNYSFTLRRGINPFEVLAMFKKIIQFTSIWKPSRLYYSQTDGLTSENPLSLINKWADARYKVVLGGLKQRLTRLSEQYRKLIALSIIVDHAEEVCKIFNTSVDDESTVKKLVQRFKNLTVFQAKYLLTLPLKQLTAKGKEDLLKEIDSIKAENIELQKKFTKIDEEMITAIDRFEAKYTKQYPAKCTTPEFIGTACYKGTGWIMLESLDECETLVTKFNSDDLVFNLFQESGAINVVGNDDPDRNPYCDIPKYLHATGVYRPGCSRKYWSIHLKGGSAFVKPPTVVGLVDNNPVPVGDKCTIISKTEGRKLVTIDPKSVRQSYNISTPVVKDTLYTSPVSDQEVIVVHCNTKVPGQVNIDRINGNGKISRVPIGDTRVIGVYRIGMPVLLSIPPEVAVRTSVRHMYFKDLGALVQPNSTLKLFLTKKRDSNDRSIVQRSHRSVLYTIQA